MTEVYGVVPRGQHQLHPDWATAQILSSPTGAQVGQDSAWFATAGVVWGPIGIRPMGSTELSLLS